MMKLIVDFNNFMKAPTTPRVEKSVLYIAAYSKKCTSAADV